MIGSRRPAVKTVFTPRGGEVNREMYIERPEAEEALRDAVEGTQNIVISGESGGGKSWLYKKTFSDLGVVYEVANCSNIATFESVHEELKNVLHRLRPRSKVSESISIEAEGNAVFAKGGAKQEKEYELSQPETFGACAHELRKKAGKGENCFVVIENLEAIFEKPKLMEQIGNLIILLDDQHYSKANVRLLLVGVPTEIRSYYDQLAMRKTISNRLVEIPEISRLSDKQVIAFSRKGLCDKLQIKMQPDTMAFVFRHVFEVTLGIPQSMQEYCFILGQIAASQDWVLKATDVDIANRKWIKTGLSDCYGVIEKICRDKFGKWNPKVVNFLAGLSRFNRQAIWAADLVDRFRTDSKEFPRRTIARLLRYLTEHRPPLLRKLPRQNAYGFVDPRYLMCLRTLKLEKSGRAIVQFPGVDPDPILPQDA